MTYLILHKVRGEPAFDVAECCDDMGTETDPGPWWIIPTSGHRAYPYWYLPLEHAAPQAPMDLPLPDDWPDHYPYDIGTAPGPSFNIMALVSKNLMTKIKRRL